MLFRSVAMALRALELSGRASIVNNAISDNMLMATHIKITRNIARQAILTLRKVRQEFDGTHPPANQELANELDAAIAGLEEA